MSTEIVNITRQVVNQKVEEIIKYYYLPYNLLLAEPQLRQKLVIRVLNHASPCYTSQERQEDGSCQVNDSPISFEEEKCIERIIHEAINQVLQEEASLQFFPTYPQPSLVQEPSHWFG